MHVDVRGDDQRRGVEAVAEQIFMMHIWRINRPPGLSEVNGKRRLGSVASRNDDRDVVVTPVAEREGREVSSC